MSLGTLLTVALLAAAQAAHRDDVPGLHVVAANNAVSVTPSTPAPKGVPAPPNVGDPAPDFAFQTRDYLWQNLHNVLEQGDVLLLFGTSDEQLRAIENDDEALLRAGVVPVAVVTAHESDAWRLVRRWNLSYSLLSDPHMAIAEQYGAIDAATGHARPMWFVIDQRGHVRGRGEGANPPHDWVAMARNALGHGDVQTTSAH